MSNIKVAVRIRPISEREIHYTGSEIVVRAEERGISLTNLKVSSSKAGDSRERTRKYGFDYCFDSSDPSSETYASQAKVYEALGESLLDVLFKGYNSCLVAYGQSASGKTYTMMGSKEDPGLTPRVCDGLFLRLAEEAKSNTDFDVSVSYLEVYNEKVRDLLKPSSSSIGLRVREHPRLGPYVQGLTHHAAPTLGSLLSRVDEGTRARKTASTLQNPTSSRSHALLTLSLQPSTGHLGKSESETTEVSRSVPRRNDYCPRGSKLHLVDLAGSESAAACGGINRLKEGANINKSLVALGNVISALAERGSIGSGPGRRFIPYRDSALTWLLKDALGGNATTVMLATISPASGSYNETSHTLRFAQRAQSVVNRPVINEDPVSRIIRELKGEIARLKDLLLEKSVNLDCKSLCLCQRDRQTENQEIPKVDFNVPQEGKPSDEKIGKASLLSNNLTIPERRHSAGDSLSLEKSCLGSGRRVGSLETVRRPESFPHVSAWLEARDYNRAKVSELIIDDQVDEPVFVDIPTLVAVLIKPDDNIQVGAHQIEEIGSEGTPEDFIDVEFSENIARRVLPSNDVSDNIESNAARIEDVTSLDDSKDHKSSEEIATFAERKTSKREKGKLRKHDSIDSDVPPRLATNLQLSKKYSSIESLTRKPEITSSFQRSQTNLDKRNVSLEKIKKLNNIKEVEDQRSAKLGNTWRNFGAWASRDFQQRKGSNDSDKSLKDSAAVGRAKNQGRKQSIDGLKRKTSKDSSSSSSKDELLGNVGQSCEKSSRKGSLDQEQLPKRTHTPIQRARRAEIVAAVTERLYSSKKLAEEGNTAPTGTTASSPASEVRSPESTDVKLASATRMRLQEISRKMLAKRRRICVDTQTDNQQTIRVRDVSCITEEPKIISKDASMLTDRHEDYDRLPSVECPITRVKEVSTLTDLDLRAPVIRCKDAGNLTDEYYEDYATINSPRNDSGIMSDDTQNYAESNLSSTEVSDLCTIGGRRSVELVENSTNTRLPSGPPNCGTQTRSDDLLDTGCSNCHARCCVGMKNCHRGNSRLDHSEHGPTCRYPESNFISISLPDMINITIETSNVLESKIKVFDGNESVDERPSVSLKDNIAQTEKKAALEIGTSTDEIFGQEDFNDFCTLPKPIMAQSDGKTFRIENIFHEPRGVSRINPKVEIVRNSEDIPAISNSLVVTNSIGTSSVPETRENATGMETSRFYRSRMFLGDTPRSRSLANDGWKNTWPARWRNSDCHWQNGGYPLVFENQRLAQFSPDNFLNKFDMKESNYEKESIEPHLEGNASSLQEPEMPKVLFDTESNEGSSTISIQNPSSISLKSPFIISMLERKGYVEQDTNFSDDSLDPAEGTNNEDDDCHVDIKWSDDRTKDEEGISKNDKVCPPDLVAHTNENESSSIPINDSVDFVDFDDEDQHVEFPKVKIEPSACSSTMNNFKTLIMGEPFQTVNDADDSDVTDFENESSTDTLIDNDDRGRYSAVDVVEDLGQCLVNGGRAIPPRSIIKKCPQPMKSSLVSTKYQSSRVLSNPEIEYFQAKKVRFAIPEVIGRTTSDSDVCEDLASEDEFGNVCSRTILEEYLDEAVAFMRNMNSMNEYMSADCKPQKFTRRRGKSKTVNYIQYEGRRISLEDDSDESANSDDDDLNFNVDSYEKCLKSMDRLEECLARVKRHEGILRDNYGIGRSSGAKLDLARSSIDSNDSRGVLSAKDRSDEEIALHKSTRPKIDGSNETKNSTNVNPNSDECPSNSASEAEERSEILKRPRIRKFSRLSDLRKKNIATYSQLKSQYGNQENEVSTNKSIDSPIGGKIGSSAADGSASTIAPECLTTPDCYLALPTTMMIDDSRGSSKEIKTCTPRQRFSLSKYDSSNESSSSNDTLAAFMESIDNVTARSRDKFKYPGSPRAKFLQLLSERRRIVEHTRSTGAS